MSHAVTCRNIMKSIAFHWWNCHLQFNYFSNSEFWLCVAYKPLTGHWTKNNSWFVFFFYSNLFSSHHSMLKGKKRERESDANQFLLLLNLSVTKIEVMYSIVSYWDEWWIQNWFWNWCLANTIIGNAKALIWYMAGAASSSKIAYSRGQGLEKKKHSMWTFSS